jgi:hypothetical protein
MHADVLPHGVEWPASGIISFSFDTPRRLAARSPAQLHEYRPAVRVEYKLITRYKRTNVGHGLTLVKAIVCTAAQRALAGNRGTCNEQTW